MNEFLEETGYVIEPYSNVWRRPGYVGIAYNDGDEIEERIATAIRQALDITVLSTELRTHCTDWPSLYHLSGSRANILRPLEASLKGDILEIGAGCGAITRYLGECGATVLALEGSPRRAAIARSRSRDLSNVTVLAEKFDQFEFNKQFDFITLIGVLEYANLFTVSDNPACSMLRRVRELLKPDGKLIIAIENQLGLKYFAGAPEDHLGQPMYGIEGRYQKDQPQTFGRRALQTLLSHSGFSQSTFMAPLPDYKLPASIVTEAGFSDPDFDAAALVWQSVRRDPQLPQIMSFSPELVWPLVAANGLALDLANSFLVVASSNEVGNSDVLAYHYSTDRRPQYCKETTFIKQPNGSEIKVVCRMLSTATEAQQEGVVLFRPEIQSDYIQGIPLSWEFIKIVSRDGWHIEDIVRYFERYIDILSRLTTTSGQKIEVFSDERKSHVHGRFIDAIPQNIVCLPNNIYRLIDTEWQGTVDISAARLLFRAMLWPMFSISRFGQLAAPPPEPLTRKELLVELFSRLGLSAELTNFPAFLDDEAKFQEMVTGKSVRQFMQWWPNTPLPVENLNIALSKREERIHALTQTLTERERHLEHLSNTLSETLNSTSWQITYPIRLARGSIERAKNTTLQKLLFIKKKSFNLLAYGPIWRLCKKTGNTATKVPFIAPWAQRVRHHVRQQMLPSSTIVIPSDGGREAIDSYLPSKSPTWPVPQEIAVTVIIPVYRGLDETTKCLNSVLKHRSKAYMRVLVIDDCSPEPQISSLLETIAAKGEIELIQNKSNLGFVASVNLGMKEAGNQDVVLLNSDTEVTSNWLDRLVGHAYSNSKIGSVTPFSNNATICSWPSMEGGALPAGVSLGALDEACYLANRGRQVDIPTAVGFCMYIRRDCIDEVGLFDEAAFGKGYGEENDFCMRAASMGWKHLLACDSFVYHSGETSFGKNSPHRSAAWEILTKRHPDYQATVARHVQADPAAPARLAVAAALFKAANKPVVLMVTHALGGGTDRHVQDLIKEIGQRANFLRLDPANGGVRLSTPQIPGLSTIVFQPTEVAPLSELLKSFGVQQVHVHHWIGFEMDLRHLIDSLGVPFDVTVHDYYSICPRINLMRSPESGYCGEPDPDGCNSCIAARFTPGWTDITEWRNRNTWLFYEAQRVICPSEDTKRRITRYFPHARLIAVPHEPPQEVYWQVVAPPLLEGERLRIAVLGAVSMHKGLDSLIAAATLDYNLYEFIVIGYCDPPLPRPLRKVITETGRYHEGDLEALIEKVRPNAIWFPSTCPETYSFTLSAALQTKLPIIATSLGAFPERLHGRPLTWTFEPTADATKLSRAFETVRSDLEKKIESRLDCSRKVTCHDFYGNEYLFASKKIDTTLEKNIRSLRRDGYISILVLPDRRSDGTVSPCGAIRLVQPFDLLGTMVDDFLIEQVDTRAVFNRTADILVCQRHAFGTLADVDRLIEHCRKYKMCLVYDLDDDLVNIPENHPEATYLQQLVPIVVRLLKAADKIWVSTPELAGHIATFRSDANVIPNALDDRIWKARIREPSDEKINIVYMGTATHDEELEFLAPIASKLRHRYGRKVQFEVVGVTSRSLPREFKRKIPDTDTAIISYPGFVQWFARQRWDIAVSPLVEGPFNQCKSAVKLMDYAALGLPIIASEHPEYETAFGRQNGVVLLKNDIDIWLKNLTQLIDNKQMRHELGRLTNRHFIDKHALSKHIEYREKKLRETVI
jgi:GT2 family glycosyltransferase/glycosyltransferase involved in cell wall biosynthesis/2-polyprenyl-3-methyl-5-hydroxy-6-metoxy-1,4-benzoquinol methylase